MSLPNLQRAGKKILVVPGRSGARRTSTTLCFFGNTSGHRQQRTCVGAPVSTARCTVPTRAYVSTSRPRPRVPHAGLSIGADGVGHCRAHRRRPPRRPDQDPFFRVEVRMHACDATSHLSVDRSVCRCGFRIQFRKRISSSASRPVIELFDSI